MDEGGAYLVRDESSPRSALERREGILRWTRYGSGYVRVSLSPKLGAPTEILVHEHRGLGPG